MKFINEIFILKPIFNFLIFSYNFFQDFGISIVLLTVLIKLLIYPLTKKFTESQKNLATYQQQIKAIQEKYRHDRAEQSQQLLEFYRANKINPFSGFLSILIQLPIFINLYTILRSFFTADKYNYLYSFVKKPAILNPVAFGFLNLAVPSFTLAVLVGLTQFFQTQRLLMKQPKPTGVGKQADFSNILTKQMNYFLPILIFAVSAKLPGGVVLYFLVSNLFSLVQQEILFKNRPSAK